MKIAILSMVASTFNEYSEDAIDMFMPAHLTDWEDVDDDQFWKVQAGLRILNESPETKKSGMHYRVFVDNNDTKDLVVRSIEAYHKMVEMRAKQEEKRAEEHKRKLEAARLSRALRQRAKTLKDAISTMELTGGDKAVLDGLRKELESLRANKKKVKA